MKHFFVVTTISFFTLSLSAVDSRLELPQITDNEEAAYKDMQSDSPGNRAAGLAYLVNQNSDLLKNLQVIKDVEGDLLCKEQSQHLLKDISLRHFGLGRFVVLHEGDELPREFYPCIILGRTERPTREELKTVYMPYTFVDHDDRARNEGSDDSDAVSDGGESQVEKEDERAIASEASENELHEQAETLLSTEDDEVEPTPYSRKRKRNSDAVMRAMKRSAVVRRNSITIPCEIGTETLVTRVSKKKYKVQVWPLV